MQKELVNLRKSNEKHFLNEDGTIQALIYDEDIHCLKDAVYEEINNTLVENNDRLCNQMNDIEVSFSKCSDENLVTFQKDSHYIKMNIVGSNQVFNKELKKDNKIRKKGSISYLNIFDNIDLNYKILPNKIKENIIINDKSAIQDKITFHIETDLELILEDNKILSNSDLLIDKSFMVDSNNIVNDNLHYELNKEDNCYELILYLDKKWLESKDRKYPVYIDPTITSKDCSLVDTYISSKNPNTNYGNETSLKVGRVASDDEYYSLIKCGLPTIGTGSTVIDAKLLVCQLPIQKPEGTYYYPIITAHQITSDWNETEVTWNNMHDKFNKKVENYIGAGMDIFYEPNNTASYTFFNITNIVKRWYSGVPNYGVLLKEYDSEYKSNQVSYDFVSKNHTFPNDDPKPYLVITYRNQNGLENYLTYETQGLGNGSLYFGHATGNMTANFLLGGTTGGSMPVSLSLFYNTNDVILNNDYGFGKGMKLNFIQTIQDETIENKLMYKYVDEDGTIHYFAKKISEDGMESSHFVDEDNLGLTLIITDNICTIEDKDKNKMVFTKISGTYYLTSIQDTEGHTSTIQYIENKLSKVIDPCGSEITVSYNTDNIVITSQMMTTTLTLTNNKITTISNDSGVTTITYSDKDIISSILDITGKKYTLEYYDEIPYRIKKVQEYGTNNGVGNSLEFIYGFLTTTIKDKVGRETICTFNNINNTISKAFYKENDNVSEAYGKSYGYSDYEPVKNKLVNQTDLIKPIRNLLWNSSFEKDDITFISKPDSSGVNNLNISFSNENYSTGFRSLKLEGRGIASYTVYIEKPGYYTFGFESISNRYIDFHLEMENGDISTERALASEEFYRSKATVEVTEPGNLEIQLRCNFEDTIAYIDDVQLEEGKVANPYNLVDNNDFHLGLAGWMYGNDTVIELNAPFVPNVVNGEADEIVTLPGGMKAFKLVCSPEEGKSKNLSFALNHHGKAYESYYAAFWYKNEGVNSYDYEIDQKATHFYTKTIPVDEKYNSGCNFDIPLNPNNTEWQFYSTYIGDIYDFKEIWATFMPLHNCNNLYITGLTIIKGYRATGYQHDENGNLISFHSKNDSQTDFKYDKDNQLIKVTTPLGNNLHFEYDNTIRNRILSGVSPSGITNQIKYDSFGNPATTKIHAQTQVDLKNGKYYIRKKGTDEYLKTNPVSRSIFPASNTCSHEPWEIIITDNILKLKPLYYDHVYILDSILDELDLSFVKQDNGSYLLKYNSKYLTLTQDGLLFKEIEDLDNQQFYFESIDSTLYIESEAEYTEDGKYLISTTDTLFNKTTYDVDMNTGLVNSLTDALGNTTNYTYNSKNQITKIQKGDMSVDYEYNTNNLLSKIRQENKEYSFDYDEFLNIKKIKIGNQTLVENLYEEKNGNLLSSTYGNGYTVTYEYDEFNRVTKIHKNGVTYCYYYDNFGNLVKISDDSYSDYLYQYDLAHRIMSYSKDSYISRYKYNDLNNLTEKKEYYFDKYNQYNYQYNQENNISTMINGDTTVSYNYDELGRVIEQNINGMITKYGYLTNGHRTSSLIDMIEQDGNIYKYQYDKLGNITRILKNGETVNQYFYDMHNQLIKEKNSDKTIINTYDDYGNIKNKKTYNNENTLLNVDTYTYGNTNWKDQLTKYNDTDITYDEIGNPITIGNASLTWINGRQLSKYEDSDNCLVATYKYNLDGIRVEKTVNGVTTKYYLEDNKIIYCEVGSNVIYFMYNNNEIIGFRYGSSNESFYYYTTYYYIKNLQGDIVGIKDSNLNLIATYEYDSWGKVISIKNNLGNEITNTSHIAIINPFRYRSYYYDSETGLYYLNSRYYNPVWGRFINADSFISTGIGTLCNNMYIYAGNNSINMIDIDGKMAILLICTMVGVVAGTAHSINKMVEHHNEKGHISAGDWMMYVSEGAQVATGWMGIGDIAQNLYNTAAFYSYPQSIPKNQPKPNINNKPTSNNKSTPVTKPVHNNSLSTTKPAQGYSLIRNDNQQILKYGETTMGTHRYTVKYLNNVVPGGASMNFQASGTKAEMHYWQHDMIINYTNEFGHRPPLNKSDW